MNKETNFCNYRDLLSYIEAIKSGKTLLILGDYRMGKTRFCRMLNATHNDVYLISFKGYDVSFIPGMINPECYTWTDLLEWICQAGYKYLIVDDADCGKNTNDFWEALMKASKESFPLKIVLLATTDTAPGELKYSTKTLSLMSWRELSDHLDLTGKELKEFLCITGGYPEIMEEYELHCSFDNQLRNLLTPASAFWNLAPAIMELHFSSIETYSTILYAMTQGKKALSTIAEFSGMKNNACLEYLKKLVAKGIIRQKESQNGHREYFIINTYIYLWYAFIYTARLKSDFTVNEELISDFDTKLRKEVYRRFFRETALDYISSRLYSFNILKDELNQDVTINKVNFDYVGYEKHLKRTVLLKCGLLTTRLLKKALRAKNDIPFHEKEYVFLFTNKSVPRGCWTLEKELDNVHIIQEKSLYRLREIPIE